MVKLVVAGRVLTDQADWASSDREDCWVGEEKDERA